jgi:MarR family transcriptional regulator, transcriptional regulator for hemolysin
MDTLATKSTFLEELSDVSRKLRTLYDARIKPLGLTLARARFLKYLASGEEGSSQTNLAEAFEVELPSMVTMIDGLERKGLVVRCRHAEDRRANGIFLTKEARDMVEKIKSFGCDLREDILDGIDEKDLCTAVRVMRQLSNNLDRV